MFRHAARKSPVFLRTQVIFLKKPFSAEEVAPLISAEEIASLSDLFPYGKVSIEYIEINPRFGGGAPMSIMAGADSCKNLYRLLKGEVLTYNEDYRENVTFLRFDSSIMLNEDMVPENEKGCYI